MDCNKHALYERMRRLVKAVQWSCNNEDYVDSTKTFRRLEVSMHRYWMLQELMNLAHATLAYSSLYSAEAKKRKLLCSYVLPMATKDGYTIKISIYIDLYDDVKQAEPGYDAYKGDLLGGYYSYQDSFAYVTIQCYKSKSKMRSEKMLETDDTLKQKMDQEFLHDHHNFIVAYVK